MLYFSGVVITVPPYNSSSERVALKGDKLQLGPALAMMFSKVHYNTYFYHSKEKNSHVNVFSFLFSVLLLSVLRGHSVFHPRHNGQ